jgi:hypothetical protein
MIFYFFDWLYDSIFLDEWNFQLEIIYIRLVKKEKPSVRNSTPIEALSFLMALLTFRLTEQGTLTLVSSAHEKKQAFLHRHIPVPAIFLATNVALMVWSNHDENIYLFIYLCS